MSSSDPESFNSDRNPVDSDPDPVDSNRESFRPDREAFKPDGEAANAWASRAIWDMIHSKLQSVRVELGCVRPRYCLVDPDVLPVIQGGVRAEPGAT